MNLIRHHLIMWYLGRNKTSLKSTCTHSSLVFAGFLYIKYRWGPGVFSRGPGQSWFEAGSSHWLRSCPETPWKCCTRKSCGWSLLGSSCGWSAIWIDMEYTKRFTFLFASVYFATSKGNINLSASLLSILYHHAALWHCNRLSTNTHTKPATLNSHVKSQSMLIHWLLYKCVVSRKNITRPIKSNMFLHLLVCE